MYVVQSQFTNETFWLRINSIQDNFIKYLRIDTLRKILSPMQKLVKAVLKKEIVLTERA